MLTFLLGYFSHYSFGGGWWSGWQARRLKKPVRIFVNIWCYFFLMVFSVCRAVMYPLAPNMRLENIRGPSNNSISAANQPYIPHWMYEMFSRWRIIRASAPNYN
jgi:hypothetical protein